MTAARLHCCPALVSAPPRCGYRNIFRKMGAALNPPFRTRVRGAYKIRQKTQEMMAEAHEQVQDIVAEVDAEGALKASKVPVA